MRSIDENSLGGIDGENAVYDCYSTRTKGALNDIYRTSISRSAVTSTGTAVGNQNAAAYMPCQ